jgi:hypothetical protein
MFLRLWWVSALLSAAFLAALPATASTITSSNGADNVGFASGSNFLTLAWSGSEPTWYNSVTSEVSAGGFSSATTVATAGGSSSVSGANGLSGGNISGFAATPMIITPPGGDGALTAIALELGGASTNIAVTLTLSDGSTVSATSTGAGGWVSFISPLEITAIQLGGSGQTFLLEDVESGTVNGADLPAQPAGGSSVPESASMWLAGGGLIVISRFLRRRSNDA